MPASLTFKVGSASFRSYSSIIRRCTQAAHSSGCCDDLLTTPVERQGQHHAKQGKNDVMDSHRHFAKFPVFFEEGIEEKEDKEIDGFV